MLLDEPTNHLDLDAVIWLETWLRNYPGTLLLISHDRDFLDTIVRQIAHIEQGQLNFYTGNYSAFEALRAERLSQRQAAFVRQQQEISRIQGFVERFRAKATKARQAQSRIKALERMERIAPAHVDSPFHFAFRAPPSLPRPLLTLDEGRAGYGDKIILDKVRLSLEPGDRIGLLGPNGAGKSTLIKVLAGQLPLASGHQGQAQGLRIGYFAQHQMDQLRPDDSPLRHLQRLAPEATEQALRGYLGGFDFAGDKALEPVAPFSGGEKARLALALVIWGRPNLLLLDEPTNHLDLEMREALGEALQDYEGALVVVSHDRHLLRVTVDQLLLVDAGRVAPFDGDLDDYPTWLLRRQTRAEAAEGSGDGGGREETSDPAATLAPETAAARKDQRRQEAEERKRLQPLRQRLQKLETRLDQLATRRATLETALAEPSLYEAEGKPRLLTLLADKQRLDAEQEEVESDWLIASEELEEALGG